MSKRQRRLPIYHFFGAGNEALCNQTDDWREETSCDEQAPADEPTSKEANTLLKQQGKPHRGRQTKKTNDWPRGKRRGKPKSSVRAKPHCHLEVGSDTISAKEIYTNYAGLIVYTATTRALQADREPESFFTKKKFQGQSSLLQTKSVGGNA